MRDEFTAAIKRTLGERVAWICSFPGCNEVTIGPGHKDDQHVVKLGVAAHITAAAPGGPRFDASYTSEERSSIQNAILLCKKHSELIDRDHTEYSADTLRQWKAQAEYKAHQNLITPAGSDNHLTTLISIGASIICEAAWLSANPNQWSFRLKEFIRGDMDMVFQYTMEFHTITDLDKYIIFERQGDGRILEKIELIRKEFDAEVLFTVKDKFPGKDPHKTGTDIDENFSFFEGDIKMVTGMASAKQAVRLTLNSSYGDWKDNPASGSYFVEYYNTFKDNSVLLNRLLKLEVTRLLSIPVHGGYPATFEPMLPFIKRVLSVHVAARDLPTNVVSFQVNGEWGNGETFAEIFKIKTDFTGDQWDFDL